MKFVSYLNMDNQECLGLYIDNNIIDIKKSSEKLSLNIPSKMSDFLQNWHENLILVEQIKKEYLLGNLSAENASLLRMLAPVPNPTSCRDGYAFRQHVATARRNRGLEMIAEFDQYPVFYFTNHNSIIGEGYLSVEADHLKNLDFELEVAIVIGKKGKNIKAKDADQYIAGYTIMNDFSARVLQMEEMKLNLGPAKGKDFATSIGPYLVTIDELEEYKIITEKGNKYNLEMKAFHNGQQISSGNMKDMNWTFAQLIERASYGVEIYPGDVIGSGTVGTGCYLELNGTHALEAKEKGESFSPVWLKDGDTVDLDVTGLGKLSHKIVKTNSDYSILELINK
ncbi:MAG: fumarylacetoacetate hydrolase family protein [Candidatus Sericytochromatia bacterium]|nr:fumarylacetoacetate hydrolase family protein [Candidatus Sericytochromatia bacterium]